MPYCIFNIKTYNTVKSLRDVQNEATRKKEYNNIDKTRTHLNEVLMGDMSYTRAYNKAMKSEYYTKPDKYGRTHKEPQVKGIGVVLSYSPEAHGTFDERAWIDENIKFLKEVFPDCPINLCCHRDETTVHLQGCIIPTTPEGKINKSYFIHGRKDLVALQDKYAERMAQFGLQRGERGSPDREDKQAQRVRALNDQIRTLETENTKLREISQNLAEALKTTQNALQEAQQDIADLNELLWLKRTDPATFKQLQQEVDNENR